MSTLSVLFLSSFALFSSIPFAFAKTETAINNLITFNKTSDNLSYPIDGLSDAKLDLFFLGKSFFNIPWVEAPASTTARDGLGPLFNANTCNSCHPKNSVGKYRNEKNKLSRAVVSKLHLKTKENNQTNIIPDPVYGEQIAINAIHGVKFEAIPDTEYQDIPIQLSGNETAILQKPTYKLTQLQYGKLHPNTVISQRKSPALIGLGYLERIPKQAIIKNADPFDKNKDGISGRINYLFSQSDNTSKKQIKTINKIKKIIIGRFTAKSSVSSVIEQSAHAAANDMGLTNSLHPIEICSEKQIKCKNAEKGFQSNSPFDLTNQRLEAISFYLKNLKIPVPTKSELIRNSEGKKLFNSIGCNLCHIPNILQNKSQNKSNNIQPSIIQPYTDLLLHDMGDGLADNRAEYSATGREFRTTALWGIAKIERENPNDKAYLHDGRARNLTEAILWHNGESKNSKNKFIKLNKKQRQQLIQFLKIL